MSKDLKILSLILVVMIATYLYCADYSGKILKHWIQPQEIHYSDDIKYRLSIVESTRVLDLFAENDRHHEIFISKQSVKPELDML